MHAEEITEYNFADGIKYLCHPHHRNKNPRKSQWVVSKDYEVKLFEYSKDSGWQVDDKGWGVGIRNGNLKYIGTAIDKKTSLFIAKFVANNKK